MTITLKDACSASIIPIDGVGLLTVQSLAERAYLMPDSRRVIVEDGYAPNLTGAAARYALQSHIVDYVGLNALDGHVFRIAR